MPPEYLMGFMHSVEKMVVNFHDEFPKLMDKDVEFVYTKLIAYYTAKASDSNTPEPHVTSQIKQDLIDEILNIVDAREELGADEEYIDNPNYTINERVITSLETLYAMAFKRLLQSSKNWRKRNGPKGYLNYIQNFL